MLALYKRFRRRRLIEQSLSSVWHQLLYENSLFLEKLDSDARLRIENAVKVIVAEKYWEGCGGLELTDLHRITIAAQIARLSLYWQEPDYFDEVKSILVYPEVYVAHGQVPLGGGMSLSQPSSRIGEAWYRGPVVLAWRDIQQTALGVGGPRNVVIHEFAHFLDMRNGVETDGIPPIESNQKAHDWIRCIQSAYREYCGLISSGGRSVVDPYGATSISEFFAVAMEAFYEAPMHLRDEFPEFFAQLRDYFQPASSS